MHLSPIANPQGLIQQSHCLKQPLEAAAGLLGGRHAESFIHLLELAMDLDRKGRWGLLPALLEDPLEAELLIDWIDIESVVL